MEKMPEKIDSKFRFVLLAANRAEQLMHGARPKADLPRRKLTVVAMREVQDEQVDWEYGPPPQPEPEPEALEVEGGESEEEVH